MLTIHHNDGKPVVTVACDRCKHRIDFHDDGIAIYKKPGAPVLMIHRDCEDERKHEHHLSIPLDQLLVEAFNSVGEPTGDSAAAPALAA